MTTPVRYARIVRKLPTQARATETVDAICEAAVQLLFREGLTSLTTIRVAKRAGVSVGTYYQYFPNKEALLITLVGKHLRLITDTLEEACLQGHYKPLPLMVSEFVHAYVTAQLAHMDTARVIYRVASTISSETVIAEQRSLVVTAIASMLRTSHSFPPDELNMIAATFFGALAGATRALLVKSPEIASMERWEIHLQKLGLAYLESFQLRS